MIEAIIGLLSSPATIGVAGSVVGFAKGIKFIQEGQAGVVLRFGKARRDKAGKPVIAKPGFIFLIIAA
jgi:regulator of protease activity HflC (stomatin/prohibitin superfamily)